MAATYKLTIDWDDDGVYEGSEEVTADLLTWTVGRGFSNRLARAAQVGRATFLMNNPVSTYTPAANPAARPMLRIRFSMTVGGTEKHLFTGRILDYVPQPGWGWRRCALQCADLVYLLQNNEIAAPVQIHSRVDEIIEAIITAAGYASTKSSLSETGIGTTPISADRWDFQYTSFVLRPSGDPNLNAYNGIAQAALSEWGRWFVDGTGQWRYYNRHHRAFGEDTDYTLYDNPPAFAPQRYMTGVQFKNSVETVKNDVRVNYYPRTVGTVDEVLARIAPGSPLSIDPGETRVVTLSYRDPAGSSAQVGALTVSPIVAPWDIAATYERTGDGPSALADLTWSAIYTAKKTTVTLTNASATQVVWVHRLQVTGPIVRNREVQQVITEDGTSQTLYLRRQLAISSSLVSQEFQARRLGQFLINQLRNPQQEISALVLNARQGDDMAAIMRDLELLDTLTIQHDLGAISTNVVVAGLAHSGDRQRGHHLTLTLEPLLTYRSSAGGTITNPFRIGDTFNSGRVMVY